ncbi:MAG: 4Fe-4S dicluster domain-containing protein [Planctomycetota bacterium]|nr:MAG: 4Fe-4S dicluster domain-containing protein [Planctomycetota bacterium]
MDQIRRAEATIDGERHVFRPGETILQALSRAGRDDEIPALCHDPRLEPAGVCRSCLVEIDGWRRLAPACRTPLTDGMVVRTRSERIERHRRTLFAMYLADNVDDEAASEALRPSELHRWAKRCGARPIADRLPARRARRRPAPNPYVAFRPERCIACARCTRYCEEVEGVSAITLADRGAYTTIATTDDRSLLETSCELCGGCIDVCPTGAMVEAMPLREGRLGRRPLRTVRTTCNYCGVGCQLDLQVDPQAREGRGEVVAVTSPPPGTLPNDGNLCVKGRFAYRFIHHRDRLRTPLVRDRDGRLREAGWREALTRAAEGLERVRRRHGAHALGFVSSSRCTVEENYLVQKLARAVFGTHNVHQCAAT